MRAPTCLAWLAILAAIAACEKADNGSGPVTISLSGTARDYFTDAALDSVTLTIVGQTGSTTISDSGEFHFSDLDANVTVEVSGSLDDYRPTRNVSISIGTTSITADLFLVSEGDASRQYVGLGLTQAVGTGVVFIDLVDDDGDPREGIPLADITLVNGGQNPVGLGPFFFGASGDVVSQASLTVSTAFDGRARVAFLDVPPGTYTLRVTTGSPIQTLTATVVISAGGATLVIR